MKTKTRRMSRRANERAPPEIKKIGGIKIFFEIIYPANPSYKSRQIYDEKVRR